MDAHVAHVWIDHMFVYVAQWRTIASFSWFALEGSHGWMDCVLTGSVGVGLVNHHTLDDEWHKEGCPLEHSVPKQFQHHCRTWSRS